MSYQETIRNNITEKIVESLKSGVLPWRMPWMTNMPKNLVSKRYYRGVNTLILAIHMHMNRFSSGIYASFKQWKDAGFHVKKRPSNVKEGEWGSPIVFYSQIEKKKTLANGEERNYKFPIMRTYTVFNLEQVEGPNIEKLKEQKNQIESNEKAERIVKNCGAKINYGGNNAYYSIDLDEVYMPNKSSFTLQNGFYGTLFHELIHWTGAEKRLNRIDKSAKFGSHNYAFEELVAEIGGCFMLNAAGLNVLSKLDNHVSYIDNWLSILAKDNKFIFQASTEANKASDYILKQAGIEQEEESE